VRTRTPAESVNMAVDVAMDIHSVEPVNALPPLEERRTYTPTDSVDMTVDVAMDIYHVESVTATPLLPQDIHFRRVSQHGR